MSEHCKPKLPLGWAQTTLGDVQLDLGRTVDPSRYPQETFELYSVPSHEHGLPELLAGTQIGSAKQTVEADVVLLCKINPRINRVWIVGAHSGKRKIASSEWIPFFPLANVETRFLAYFLRQNALRDFLAANASGVGGSLMRVRAATFRDFPFPLAPLREQERIADALDELLSDLDAGVAALERARDKLKLYRAAVLKAAVEGALTAQWRKEHPQTEPAAELIKRILAERRRRWEEDQLRKFKEKGREPPKNWKAKYQDPVAPDATETPELPPGWALASMDALTLRITSGSRDWQQYYGSGTGTFVMAQNVRPGRFDARHHQRVNPPLDDPSCERSRVEDNDLLVTIVGANTGDVCRVPEPLNEHYVCQSVALMRPIEERTARYLECYYNAQNGGQRHYQRYIYGAGRPHLSFDQLKMTPVAIPPIEEQAAIIDAIEDQLSIVEHLEADLDARVTSAQALRQSILRHAFSGKLVPQDLNDEPASELLKRIAAEREQRIREAGAAKRLNGHKPPGAAKARGKAAGAKSTKKKEPEHGRIADR